MPKPFDPASLKLPEGSEIYRLLERCPDIEKLRFTDGDYLMREGQSGQETYLILSGSYVVEHEKMGEPSKRGNPLTVQIAESSDPQFIGEMAYLGGEARSASVRCSGALYALCLQPDHLDIIIDDFPILAKSLAHQFTRRLQEANRTIRNFRDQLEMNPQMVFKQPGDAIITAGSPCETLYQLIDGVVTVSREGESENISASRTSTDFLNAREFFRGEANTASIHAKSGAILIAIEQAHMESAIRNFPQLVIDLLCED